MSVYVYVIIARRYIQYALFYFQLRLMQEDLWEHQQKELDRETARQVRWNA